MKDFIGFTTGNDLVLIVMSLILIVDNIRCSINTYYQNILL
jgi:hypothetical protein